MDDDAPPRIAQHEAADRFGRTSLRTAHELTAALAANDGGDEEPVVRRTGGPHRSIGGLAALLDAALADEAAPAEGGAAPPGAAPRPAGRSSMTTGHHPARTPRPSPVPSPSPRSLPRA